MRKPRAVEPEKEQHWRKVFALFQSSGLPFKKFCAQEKISPNTFQFWRRELRRRDEARGIESTISKGDNRPSNLQQNIDYWLRIINEINSHDGSVRSYCRSHGVTSGNLHYWEKRLIEMKLTNGFRKGGPKEKRSNVLFAPLEVLDDRQECASDNRACNEELAVLTQVQKQLAAELVEPRTGCRVRIFNGADHSTLAALVAALSPSHSSGF